MTGPTLSIVVPVFNEEESLRPLLAEVDRAVSGLALDTEILFVDDGSTDASFAVIRELAAGDARVRGLQFRRNQGKAAALAAGFARARGERVVMIDADLQDDPAQIPRLLARLDEGFDLVSGWKRRRQDPWHRRAASRVFNVFTGWVAGIPLHDMNCGLKVFRREVTATLRLYGDLHRFIVLLAHREGFRVGELEVPHRPRAFGRSKYGGVGRLGGGLFDLLTTLFLTRFARKPLHLFGFAGLALAAAGAAITAWLTYERLVYRVYLSNRPLLLAGVFLIIVGVQVISVGLVGEMLTAHVEATRDAPAHGIRSEVGFERRA